jgi:hypothetical protein
MVQRIVIPPIEAAITMRTVSPADLGLSEVAPETEAPEVGVEELATDSVSVTSVPEITLVLGDGLSCEGLLKVKVGCAVEDEVEVEAVVETEDTELEPLVEETDDEAEEEEELTLLDEEVEDWEAELLDDEEAEVAEAEDKEAEVAAVVEALEVDTALAAESVAEGSFSTPPRTRGVEARFFIRRFKFS